PFLPVAARAVRFFGAPTPRMWSHATLVSHDERGRTLDVAVHDESGACVVLVEGLRIRELDPSAATRGPGRLEDALHVVAWPVAAARRRLPRAVPPASWLVLEDDAGVGQALVDALQRRGDRCVRVTKGRALARIAEDRFELDPARPEDVHAIVEELRRGDRPACRGVVHLWSLDDAPPPPPDAEASVERLSAEAAALGAQQVHGTAVVLHTLRELAGQRWAESPRLWLATRGAQRLEEDPPSVTAAVSPSAAALWGLGRTIAQEHPDLFGAMIDLDATRAPEPSARALLRELVEPDGEPQIALRGDHRHVARLRRARALAAQERPWVCRPDASYLVTGGLGGLGLLVARGLVERGARRLVLMGRTALPPRHAWGSISPQSRAFAQVTAVRALEAQGVSVHLAAVDVGDAAQLAGFLQQFRAEGWPPIRGVVHLAGVLQDRILVRLDAAMLGAVVHAKVVGAWLLHRLLAGEALDFFVSSSSIAAVLGSAGQGNYAAANAFLGALAHHRRAAGLPAHAIDWGPWAEVGVASRDRGRLASRGIEGLEPDAPMLLWPHDALDGAGLQRHEISAMVLVSAPERVRQQVDVWRARRGAVGSRMQIAEVRCPGRLDREQLATFWRACARPRVLLRGDSGWTSEGAAWLRSLGANVEVQGRATQLSLI
ncbi:MAG: SDR family NAD(P)-dependent oxidoreductase, partial [Myxococcales bacterium]|nr:SDR family NAD(P)-dependent oxidoreductase [Myxococcales bacterium]